MALGSTRLMGTCAVDRQVKGMPLELVKSYSVRVSQAGRTVWMAALTDNYRRHNILPLPDGILGDRVAITVSGTHGHPNARIFEIRAC